MKDVDQAVSDLVTDTTLESDTAALIKRTLTRFSGDRGLTAEYVSHAIDKDVITISIVGLPPTADLVVDMTDESVPILIIWTSRWGEES